LAEGPSSKEKEAMTIKEGSKVVVEYTLSVDGRRVDAAAGSKSLKYTHSQCQIIPGLEKGLVGLRVGDMKTVTVKSAEGFGQVNQEAFLEVDIEQVPREARKVGAELSTKDPSGEVIPMRVKEVKGESIVLDFNHPLAGKTLVFDVKIISVE
jgi:FKBP-type peptidyl-prolyl cis-trans isomerase 2